METCEKSALAAGSTLNPVPADIANTAAADVAVNTSSSEPVAPVAESQDREPESCAASHNDERLSIDAVVAALAEIAAREASAISRDEVGRLKGRFYALRKAEVDAALTAHLEAGGDPAAFITVADPREQQLKDMLEVIRVKKSEYARAVEAEQEANAAAKEEIIARLAVMAEDTDNVNRLFPEFRELRDKFKTIGNVPPTRTTELWKRFQEAVEQFYDRLKINKDLRDYDFKKNLEAKTRMCEEAESLSDAQDIVAAFHRLQGLHDEWREIGPVAKEEREAIWVRFKEASVTVNKKYQQHFEDRKAEELQNEAAKIALCERVEAMDFSDLRSYAAWEEMTRHMLAAQEEWKQLGYASRKVNAALFARFRQTCDRFFTAKSAHYSNMKNEMSANLAAKNALCAEAETLAETATDWRQGAEAINELQKKWRAIGVTPRKQSDAVWRRFKEACDKFYARRKEATGVTRSNEKANLQQKRAIIAEMRELAGAEMTREQIKARVRDAQNRWQQIGFVPLKEKDAVYSEFRDAIDSLFEQRDAGDRRNRAARFEKSLNEMGDAVKVNGERERLCRVLERQRSEIKTCENNLGFFSSKSKSGDSMLRELERRIERLRADMQATEDKIKLIDSKR